MNVGEFCNRVVVVTEPRAGVAEAAELMRRHHTGDLVIVEERAGVRRPVGIVTDRDLVVEVLAKGVAPERVVVGDLMTRELHCLREDQDLWSALEQMRQRGVRRAPVLAADDDALIGILTLDDYLELLAEALAHTVDLVRREIRQERRTRP